MSDYTWVKLNDGTWGVAGEGGTPGTVVTVHRRDGTSSMVTLGEPSGRAYGKILFRVTSQQKSNTRRYGGSGETKQCWECGRNFTYGDCKENDGDWRDSYCGC